MKTKLIWILIILVIVIVIFTRCTTNNNENNVKLIDLNVGDEFTGLSYPNKMYVLNYEISDMTGDGNKDMVILIGEKERVEDTYARNIDVVLYDNQNETYIKVGMKNMSGNNNLIKMGDCTGDNISDALVISQNDNGTYTLRIIGYENTKLSEIFKERNNKGIVFDGKFLDGFKANILNRKLNKEYTIELVDRKENYIKNGFYNESGKLNKEEAKVTTSQFTNVEMVQLNDRNGIKTTQRITGFDDLDIIDEVEVIWKYEDGKWQMKEANGVKIGNLLY